jgi:hypothetical protein
MKDGRQVATSRRKPPRPDRVYVPRVYNKGSRKRFDKFRMGELLAHLGRPATAPEKLIIRRICSIEF